MSKSRPKKSKSSPIPIFISKLLEIVEVLHSNPERRNRGNGELDDHAGQLQYQEYHTLHGGGATTLFQTS